MPSDEEVKAVAEEILAAGCQGMSIRQAVDWHDRLNPDPPEKLRLWIKEWVTGVGVDDRKTEFRWMAKAPDVLGWTEYAPIEKVRERLESAKNEMLRCKEHDDDWHYAGAGGRTSASVLGYRAAMEYLDAAIKEIE